MQLMPEEQIVYETPSKALILTTHRVRHKVDVAGNAHLVSIMLEELASCGMLRVNHLILLVLALVAALGGVFVTMQDYRNDPTGLIIGLVIAAVLIALFFGTRQTLLSLASAGSTIRLHVVGMKYEAVVDLIDRIEAAKNQRELSLFQRK